MFKNVIYKSIVTSIIILAVSLIFFNGLIYANERVAGEWRVIEEIDPLTDEIYFLVYNINLEGKVFYIRHQNHITDLFIHFDDNLVIEKDQILADIMYRFDDGEVYEEFWELSTDGDSLFYPTFLFNLESFVRPLMQADKIAIGYFPQGKIRQTTVFNLNGLNRALEPYLDFLGW